MPTNPLMSLPEQFAPGQDHRPQRAESSGATARQATAVVSSDDPSHLFDPAPGYLNAATMGLPPRRTREVLAQALQDWSQGRATPVEYDEQACAARALYARLVGVAAADVAIGAQTSVTAGSVASSLRDGASVVCVDGDFSSMVFPFLAQAHRGVTVKHVPLADLPSAVGPGTDLVAFSLAQSADGLVADGAAVAAAARAVGAVTFCDTTQAAGWMPIRADEYDITVCSAYKWLCCPRGTAFTTVMPSVRHWLQPVNAGWYAGESIWDACYGPAMHLAQDARRFDVSPAWLSFAGAVPSLEAVVNLTAEQMAHGVRLADDLRQSLGLDPQGRPVLSLDDPDGALMGRLVDAGCSVAARAGKVRIAFHLWNTRQDVARAVDALAGSASSLVVA